MARRALHLIWGNAMWWVIPFWRRDIRGLEHLGEGPYVVVSNHQSVLDIPILFSLPLPLAVAARPGLFHVTVMGPFLRWSGQINSEALVKDGEAALDAGVSVAVFAEGQRNTTTGLRRLRKGAFVLAEHAEKPLLPVVIEGTRHIIARRGYLPSRLRVTVHMRILPPIDPGPDAHTQCKQVMSAALAQLQGTT